MKPKSKSEKVKAWLLSGKSLTQAQAVDKFKAYRLSSIIHALKDKGYDIISIPMPSKNKETGLSSNFVKYKIHTL